MTPPATFRGKHPISHSIAFFVYTVVTPSEPIHFVVMKRSRTEKSPWIKSKTKPGPNKKKIDDFHPDRRQNLAESDRSAWFNQLSETEAGSVSSLDVSAASKEINNGSEESRREQCYERANYKNEHGLFFIVGLFIESSLFLFCGSTFFSFRFVLCWPRLKLVSPWTRAAALASCFLAQRVAFLLFCLWLTTVKTYRLERGCNTSREAQVWILWTLWGSINCFIGSRLFKLTHSSVKAWYAYKSLEGSLNESIGYADLTVFHEIW